MGWSSIVFAVDTIGINDVSIEPIIIHQIYNEAFVESVFGKRTLVREKGSFKQINFTTGCVCIDMRTNEIIALALFRSSKLHTYRNITIGMTLQDVISMYGVPNEIKYKKKEMNIYYKGLHQSVQFAISKEDGRITFIGTGSD